MSSRGEGRMGASEEETEGDEDGGDDEGVMEENSGNVRKEIDL